MKKMTESEFNALSDEELEAMDMSQIEIIPDSVDDADTGSNDDINSNSVDDNDDEEGDDEEEDDDDAEKGDDEFDDDADASESGEEADKNSADASDDVDDVDTADDDDADKDKLKDDKDVDDDDDADPDADKDPADTSEGDVAKLKSFYDALMQPFKANGIDMHLRTPEEWVSMAQKGANYTQKMQGLAPNLKLLRMLENHGVLNESKLSFLIDLDKRDPAAIQKLMKDGDIDPMTVDTDAESTYEGKSHAVSDQEHLFATAVGEVANSGVNGKALIREMNASWDTQSKDEMYQNPGILHILREQKESGVYETIMTEVKRRQALDQLTGVPVLVAYKSVGEELANSGQLQNTGATNGNTGVATTPDNSAPRSEVKTRTRKRKRVSDNERANAAAPSRSGGSKTKPKQDFNPLAMSDEEFEKQFG